MKLLLISKSTVDHTTAQAINHYSFFCKYSYNRRKKGKHTCTFYSLVAIKPPPHNKENNSKGRSSWWNKKQTYVLLPLFIYMSTI